MIDLKTLRELVRLMKANDLTELDIRDKEDQITLKRPGPEPAPAAQVQYVPAQAPAAAAPPHAAPTAEGAAPAAAKDEGLIEVKSPMVGTFYSASSPDADPYVNVGSTVQDDTVVCLIEAMKVYNEIKAEVRGTVERVLVSNGQVVEFGQPLFLVRP